MHRSQNQVPFYIHLSYLFVALLLGFALITGWNQYRASEAILKQSAEQQFGLAEKSAQSEIETIYQSGRRTVQLLAQQRLMRATTLEERLDSLKFVTTSLENEPIVSAQYIGYDTGDFFLVRNYLENPSLKQRFNPPANTRWIVQSITHAQQKPLGEYLFYDVALRLIERRIDPKYIYDPRVRNWYRARDLAGQVRLSEPNYFFVDGLAVITFSQQTENLSAVVGSNIHLGRLNEYLLQHRLTPDTRFALVSADERVLASHKGLPALMDSNTKEQLPKLSHFDAPVLKTLLGLEQAKGGTVTSFAAANGDQWEGMATTLRVGNDISLRLLMASPHRELLAAAIAERERSILLSSMLILLGVVAAIWLSLRASRPINALTDEVQKIEQFQFEQPVQVQSNILEIARLANGLGGMKQTISRFMNLSQALAVETNFSRLLAKILDELGAVSQATGGVIYIYQHTGTGKYLEASQYFWHCPAQAPSKAPLQIQLDGEHTIARALRESQLLNTVSPEVFENHFPLLPKPSQSMELLVFPLSNRDGDLIGALALAIEPAKTPSHDLLAFMQAIVATAAVAVDTQRLIKEQKGLLEAFIQLIAGAIDSKSPYTGGHCQRVPELTKMLARAAEQQTAGPFADFKLNEEQWEELHIAAWLHDCGKITTPEYIVDKATKLETLYDRIHEVRMRFEVIKRDVQIAHWQAIAAGGNAETLSAELNAQLAQLDEEFAFIATCNEGGEFMAPEKIERLKHIGARTWQRTLSDRVGISHEEKERKLRTPELPLPVLEALLADKPEHILTRAERDKLPDNNQWGFKVKVPEHMYNRGELYNLSVARGTLSEEERFKINEHIIQTIIMLEKLPFPRYLQRVPEIAGGHHEKMDGTGYPKRLSREQMSTPARMMAIADIFEALTAIDRPYKKGKTLSEAIKIMGFMVKDQHIDAELFALFLSEGVHLEYAKRFMRPEQIDDVDITPYVH